MQSNKSSNRRAFCAGLSSVLGSLAFAPALAAGQTIPQRPSARVIVDNDFGGDPDGLLALAHQLLSPKTRVPLVTVSALNPQFSAAADKGRTAGLGCELARELIRRVGMASPPAVASGAEDFSTGPTGAARAIVEEALRDDPLPLIVTCGGPLTNVAAALRMAPGIAKRMTVIWIGGGGYPRGGWEYNLMTDVEAARLVIERSSVPLWMVPQPAYRQMQYSVAELGAELRPVSPLGAWLYDRFTMPPDWADIGGAWPLGDSPLVLLSAISAESSRYRDVPARRILRDGRYGGAIAGRSVRMYQQLDVRLVLGDFIALLKGHAASRAGT